MASPLRDRYERITAKDREEWRRWLAQHHDTATGIWLIYFKKKSGQPTVNYAEAVEEALCFGWIDSLANPLDADRHMQLFTPRKPKSGWSALNKQRIEAMIEQGRMTPAGQAKIDAARADGSWTKLDAIERLEIPEDLHKAFSRNRKALANFNAFSPSRRKTLLHWINNVKSAELRAQRIRDVVARAAEEG